MHLSLAGAQDKLTVIVQGDAIGLARGGWPTTNILKPVIQGLEGTVENELFCLRLAGRLNLQVPAVEMRWTEIRHSCSSSVMTGRTNATGALTDCIRKTSAKQ